MSIFIDILIQAAYYGIVLLLAVFLVSFLLKGFFWKYIKVRLSFGRKVLVKIRGRLTDHYSVGWIESGFLVYINPNKKSKSESNEVRLALEESSPFFYKSLAVNWVDVSEERNALCTVNYNAVSGFDQVKYSDLLTRALMRPAESPMFERIMIILMVIVLIGVVASVFLAYTNYNSIQALKAVAPVIGGSSTLI